MSDIRLPGSVDASCTNGHKLRVIRRNGKINAIATYREQEQWWEYIDASEPFCPKCGGEVKCK
jgi:hypothetical protein